MKKETYSTKEVLYSTQKSNAFFSKNYDFVKRNIPFLQTPRFMVKDSKSFIESLTYRKINDWDTKGLISGSRENNQAGWRKFSMRDIIKLNIITDLRKFGCCIEKIKNILDKVANGYVGGNGNTKKKKRIEFLQLEFFVFMCLSGYKILLLIDDEENIFFLDENDAVKIHFDFDGASSPIIVLPFFYYIEKLATVMRKDIKMKSTSTINELFELNLTRQEKKVLEIIRSKEYEEITLKKSNNERISIKAKSKKSGKYSDEDIMNSINVGDYQWLTAIIENGERVSIIQEKRIKV